jgi:antitoxin component YwqK of YwqJK toxin-antitoxin module
MRAAYLLLLPALLLACANERFVAAEHPDGRPQVEIFMKGKGEEAVKVMEKVYYPNGQLEYVGRFEDGKEHGLWEYFYEDGTRKYAETWVHGKEHGIHYDYAPDGQVARELHYDHGKLIKEVDRSRK